MMLVHEEIKLDTQRVLDLLSDYRVEQSSGIEDMDFMRQVNHFLGAKKSEGMKQKSTSNYRMCLELFADYINKAAADVTVNDIREYITYLSDVRGNKTSSIQSYINILRSFFTWMHNEELIPKNPTIRIKSFRIDKKESRHPLTSEQLEMLRDACKTYREKALVEFLYSTGCRLSEVEQINAGDVDFDNRSVSIIGKGSKRRTLYFSVKARLMLRNYLSERKGGTTLFCTTRKPYNRLGKRSIQLLLKNLGERAGIAKRVHPHVLRHTFATHMLNAGMDITVIQQLMGHSSVGSTEIYTELSQENIYREYQKYIA